MPPDEALRIPDILGLKVHVCSLVAQDSASDFSWAPVCIYYKLMNINDVLTVDDSASVNARIMQVDSELNIAREWEGVPKVLWHKLRGASYKWKRVAG